MSPDAPRVVRSLVTPDLVIGVCQIACYCVLATSAPRPVGVGFGLVGAAFAAVITLRAVRVASTRVTEAGISQLTWDGRRHLPWADVTGLTRKPFALTAHGRRVIVPVEVFENTAAVIAYIESHVPSAVVRNA